MLKKYEMSFEVWGLLLFLVVMIPTFIWSAVPAPNDVLRAKSITEEIDMIASACQVLMVVALCIFRNRDSEKMGISLFTILMSICCLLYFVSWILYFAGIVNKLIILGLTLPPCLTFLFFAMDRKNRIAMFPILGFTICHLIYGVVNFII